MGHLGLLAIKTGMVQAWFVKLAKVLSGLSIRATLLREEKGEALIFA